MEDHCQIDRRCHRRSIWEMTGKWGGKPMRLIRPTVMYIAELQAFREKFPTTSKGIEGSSLLQEAASIETWIEQMEKNRYAETVQDGWVPAEQYIAIDEETGEIVGVLNFRKELNDVLFNYYGHIGYAVSPTRRRQGVGTQMLQLALSKAKEIGLRRVLIKCDAEWRESFTAKIRVPRSSCSPDPFCNSTRPVREV